MLPHVAEYYSRLSGETIYQFLLQHHENIWPGIRQLVCELSEERSPFILEGSALRPECTAGLGLHGVSIVHLYSDHDFIRDRMQRKSRYDDNLDRYHRLLVDRFVDRSLRDNDRSLTAAREHGLLCIDVRDTAAVERLRADMVSLTNRRASLPE